VLLNFKAKHAAHEVPNAPRFPQLAELEIVRIFNDVITHLPAEECSALRIETDLICLNACAQVRVEINASCAAPENVAVLDGAYSILVIESAEMDGQLIKEFHDFGSLIAGSSSGLAVASDGGGGVIGAIGEFVAAAIRACRGARERSGFDCASEEIVKREGIDLLVIAESGYKARGISAFEQLDGSLAQLDVLGIQSSAAE